MRVNGYSSYDWQVGSATSRGPQQTPVQTVKPTSAAEDSGQIVRKVASDPSQRSAFARLVARASELGRHSFQALSAYLTTSSYEPLDEKNSVELVGIDTYV